MDCFDSTTRRISGGLRLSKPARHTKKPLPKERISYIDLTDADLLTSVLTGQGSSKGAVVGDTGIEPVTSSV